MTARDHIRFRDGDDILTMWVEKEIEEDGEVIGIVGWVPEKRNNWIVNPLNVVRDEVKS